MFAQNLEEQAALCPQQNLRGEKASKIKRCVKKKKGTKDVFKRDCVMTEEYINCICF